MANITAVPPKVTAFTTPCPHCLNPLGVYVFTRATDWENTPKGLLLHVKTWSHLGPHACCGGEDA